MNDIEKLRIRVQAIADMGDKQIEALALSLIDLINVVEDKKQIGFKGANKNGKNK